MSNKMRINFYERQLIEVRIRGKWSYRKIGRYLKRDHTVIKREIDKNKQSNGVYSAVYAQKLSEARKKKTNTRILNTNIYLARYVIRSIRDNQLSPEQIAGRLKKYPPAELEGISISHESIYQWIYNEEKWLYKYLRRKMKPQRKKKYSRKKRISKIPDRTSIHIRPNVINKRRRIGDWESDSMKFSKQKTALSVQYERKTMLVRINKVANLGKDETYQAITKSINSLPQYYFHSITFDNGGEGARHKELGIKTYFCDPYKSWQKGGVENINGLIRQYLPRKIDIDNISDKQIYYIQEKLNNRPRKSLNYLTPNEFIQREVTTVGGALKT